MGTIDGEVDGVDEGWGSVGLEEGVLDGAGVVLRVGGAVGGGLTGGSVGPCPIVGGGVGVGCIGVGCIGVGCIGVGTIGVGTIGVGAFGSSPSLGVPVYILRRSKISRMILPKAYSSPSTTGGGQWQLVVVVGGGGPTTST